MFIRRFESWLSELWAWFGAESRASERGEGGAMQSFRLCRGAVLGLEEGAVVRVEVVFGKAWVTRSGDGWDYVLRPGDVFESSEGGKVVVQALTEARVRVWRG